MWERSTRRSGNICFAVTCAILAPVGPNRSRILASLYRDERKINPRTPHQLAKLTISSNDRLASSGQDDDPSSANEPAVMMEHNLLVSSKIYNNIMFRGLGALLDLTPGAAETMARKMIEQDCLRGSINQVDKLIWFKGSREEDDVPGKAGGLGDVEEAQDTGALLTKHWDMQI
ncbi:hypothetical protein B0H10DRAFT_2363009 [Mycena sp. CBHHK59/15]|nr:hypothetical protein B0H10DRAFT_2363009 [Mycena sp. CBHHK59/15]